MRSSSKLLKFLPILVVLLASFSQAQFISAGATAATSTSATLNFATPAPTTTLIQWGTTITLGNATQVDAVPTTKHTVVLTNLTPGTIYRWRVIATDLYGEVAVGNYQQFATPILGHLVSLSWTEVRTDVSFNVYRSQTSGGPYTKITPVVVIPQNYADSAISAGLTYYYVTTAVDSTSHESPYSNEITAKIPSP